MGKRDGFTCLYSEDAVAMLAEYRLDELKCLRLIAGDKVVAEYISKAEADDKPAARLWLTRLEGLEKEILTNEVVFKKEVREQEQDRRKARAAKLGVEKRAAISQRENERRAATGAFIEEMTKAAHGIR